MTISTGTGRRGGRIPWILTGADLARATLAGTALVCAALVAAPAFAAPPLSETTKAKMAAGHWTGGGPALSWQPEPDRPYVYNPPLGQAVSRNARGEAAPSRPARPVTAMTQIDERTLAGWRGATRPLAAAAGK